MRRLLLDHRTDLSGFHDGCVVVETVIVLLKEANMVFRELRTWHLLGISYRLSRCETNVPGLDADMDFALTSRVLVGVDGVCCIEIYLNPPTLRPAITCAGIAHLPGCVRRGLKLRDDTRGISIA